MTVNSSSLSTQIASPHVSKSEVEDVRILERSNTVLWTLAPSGIVLHNLANRRYIELDNTGYKVWGFLDGARTVDSVITCCYEKHDVANDHWHQSRVRDLRDVINTLSEYGFIVKRER